MKITADISTTGPLRARRVRAATLVGFVIAVVIPLASPIIPFVGRPSGAVFEVTKPLGLQVPSSNVIAHVERNIAFKWIRTIALVALVIFGERRSLKSLGLRRIGWRDAAAAVTAYLVCVYSSRWLAPILPATAPSDLQRAVLLFPASLRAAMALTAAVTEEIESRGFLIERVEMITGSTAFAGCAGFSLALLEHLSSWDLTHVVLVAPWTGAFVVLYLWRRNLFACMLLHALQDLTAFRIL